MKDRKETRKTDRQWKKGIRKENIRKGGKERKQERIRGCKED